MQKDKMSTMSQGDALQPLLAEIWDRFHPAILWWVDKRAATDPVNAHLVYRELLSGPRGAMEYASRLRPFVTLPIR